ncbi:hypothetical protein Tco_1530644 [Tanacetum coccineum]
MDQDLVHMVAALKVAMLKPGEYELWRMRIKQYIQMIDYSLWEVISHILTLLMLEANVPNDADYDVWLPLALIHEARFHDVSLVAYTLDSLSLIAMKISILMMLDSYTNFMCFESWGWSSYARVLIKVNACNDFIDNLVMVVPYIKGNGYTKETICIEDEWVLFHCNTCLIYGHSLNDCPKAAPKREVNGMAKGKGQTPRADDEGFIEVKKKNKSGCNNGGTKNFKPVSIKPKTRYQPKAKQSTEGASKSSKATPFVDMIKASTSGYNKESPSNRGNGFFSLSNSFEALNVESSIIEEVAACIKATT